MDFDIIGDIHGQVDKLKALLQNLGYRETGGAWRQSGRTAIFVGDFIDRGPRGVETVEIVRAMVYEGTALAVMGNHELNAIAWHTPDSRDPGGYLRPRRSKNRQQHQAFLDQVESHPAVHADLVAWFLTLPLWLDLEGLRVVHACWHTPFMDWLSPQLAQGRFLRPEMIPAATLEPEDLSEKDTASPSVFKAVEALTKGLEIPLPTPHSFLDKDGHRRHRVRIRWWDRSAVTYQDSSILSEDKKKALPDLLLPESARLIDTDSRPVFFGHYWMTGVPQPLSDTAVCVDYSAGNGGPLVAYRWRRGEPLDSSHFMTSDAPR